VVPPAPTSALDSVSSVCPLSFHGPVPLQPGVAAAVGSAADAAPSLRRSCAAALPLPPPPASSLLPPPPLLLLSPLSPPPRCGRNFGRRRSSFPARPNALARRFVAGHHSKVISPMTCRLSSLIVCLHDPYTRPVFSEPLARPVGAIIVSLHSRLVAAAAAAAIACPLCLFTLARSSGVRILSGSLAASSA
jgi:hypothetical protein